MASLWNILGHERIEGDSLKAVPLAGSIWSSKMSLWIKSRQPVESLFGWGVSFTGEIRLGQLLMACF